MAPGLGERSTAYPGQVAWAASDKTIHILRKKRTQQQQNHTTENRIKQTNDLIKKGEKWSFMHLPQTGSFHFLLFSSSSFSWGCNFINQVLSVLAWITASDHFQRFTLILQSLSKVSVIVDVAPDFVKSIFSGSCQQPQRGSLCGSWQQPQPCNHRDSCACRSTGGCHRTGSHSDSRTLWGPPFCGTWSTCSS